MAHIGGSFHGGGFHGGGFHGGGFHGHVYGHGHSSAEPKYIESIGPDNIWGYILFPVLSLSFVIFLMLISLVAITSNTTPNNTLRMNQFALEKYASYYPSDDNDTSENNIVLVILTSEKYSQDGYYATSAIGDNIKEAITTVSSFNMYSTTTTISSIYKSEVNHNVGTYYLSSLCSSMTKVINELNEKIQTQESHFYKKTKDENNFVGQLEIKPKYLSYSTTEKENLNSAISNFKKDTNITLSLVIADMYDVMGIFSNVVSNFFTGPVSFFSLFALFIFFWLISQIIAYKNHKKKEEKLSELPTSVSPSTTTIDISYSEEESKDCDDIDE